MSEILNANPTIRNASDLPSRRRQGNNQRPSKVPQGLFASTVPASAYLPDPFSPSTSSESDFSDEDDGGVEPIDEQEIYGKATAPTSLVEILYSPDKPLRIALSQTYALIFGSANWYSQLTRSDLIAPIADPEHPLTLGSLSVVNLPDIHLSPTFPDKGAASPLTTLTVLITPTITHCSLATVIGLGVRVRLEQALPPRFRVDVRIKEGTHSTAEQVNRQLGDKERVAAALENGTLMGVLRNMLKGCDGTAV